MTPEAQTERYLDILVGNHSTPVMWAWHYDKSSKAVKSPMYTEVGAFHTVQGKLTALNQEGNGIFCLVNESDGKSRKKSSIKMVRAIWADFDEHEELPAVPLEPSMVVKTRNGWHIYYVLESPSENLEWGEGMNKLLCDNFRADHSAKDVARVLRVPGTYHCKEDPYMVELEEDAGYRYTIQEIEDALGVPQPVSKPTYVPVSTSTPTGTSAWGEARLRGLLERMGRATEGCRNMELSSCCFKIGQGVGSGQIDPDDAVRTAWEGAAAMNYNENNPAGEAESTINSALAKGEKSPVGPTGPVSAELGHCVAQKVVVSPASESLVAHRDGLLERVTAGIDRRISVGFNPAPGPLERLNDALGGGVPAGAVTLLGAPPGMGKSSLALDWAYSHAGNDRPALFCSLELSELDLYSRLCTLTHAGRPWLEVRCGKHREDLLETVRGTLHMPFYVATRHGLQGVDGLRVYADELAQKYGQPPLIVIDYLQLLIQAGETREQWVAMTDISGAVANIAQDTGAAIICITAINRQSYNSLDKSTGKPDKYMALAAAKQSGRLEYDAEVIMGLQLFDMTDGGQHGWLCIAKNRSGGSTGNIGIRYEGMSGKFGDADESDVYAALAAEREGGKKGDNDEIKLKLLQTISRGEFSNSDKLTREAGVPRERGRSVLVKLEDARLVERNVHGMWTLTPKGDSDGFRDC